MELLSNTSQFFSALLVFMTGMIIAGVFNKLFQVSPARFLLLYVWHTIFCIVFANYVLNNGGDALMYYTVGVRGTNDFSLGTAAVKITSIFFVHVLGLSFLSTFLAFNVMGFIGLLAVDASLRVATENKSKYIRGLATVIVFLPSISFWTSGIGKDAIAFMASGFALWAALNLKRRWWLMVPAVVMMLLIRPHVGAIMVMALGGSVLLERKVPLSQRLMLGAVAVAASAVMVPLALNYAGVGENASADDVASYIENRQQYNTQGGGGIDIASMSPPMQLFAYLFRPLPIEARSAFALAASVDNIILLFLFIAGGRQILKRRKLDLPGNRPFMWIFSLMTWGILAVTTANLGISLRQKWMFAPMLIFLLISLIGKNKQEQQPAKKLDRILRFTRRTNPVLPTPPITKS